MRATTANKMTKQKMRQRETNSNQYYLHTRKQNRDRDKFDRLDSAGPSSYRGNQLSSINRLRIDMASHNLHLFDFQTVRFAARCLFRITSERSAHSY